MQTAIHLLLYLLTHTHAHTSGVSGRQLVNLSVCADDTSCPCAYAVASGLNDSKHTHPHTRTHTWCARSGVATLQTAIHLLLYLLTHTHAHTSGVSGRQLVNQSVCADNTSCPYVCNGKWTETLLQVVDHAEKSVAVTQRHGDSSAGRAHVLERRRRRQTQHLLQLRHQLPAIECIQQVDVARRSVQHYTQPNTGTADSNDYMNLHQQHSLSAV